MSPFDVKVGSDTPICNYLKQLLPGWLHGDVATGLICAIASVLQTFMDLTMDARTQTFPAQARDDSLKILGIDRVMSRFPTETIGDFRKRLIHAFELHAQGGTRPGLEKLLELLLPNTQTEIREFGVDNWHLGRNHLGVDTYLFDSDALFTFKVRVFDLLENNTFETLTRAIDEIKPAHTRAIVEEAA